MFGKKKEFYWMMDLKNLDDEAKFRRIILQIMINGINPVEVSKEKIIETETGEIKLTVIMIKCKEKWPGALKKLSRKIGIEFTNQQYNNLDVYAT